MQGTYFVPADQARLPRMTFIPNPHYRKPKGLPYPVKLPPEYEVDEEGRAVLKKKSVAVPEEPEEVADEVTHEPEVETKAVEPVEDNTSDTLPIEQVSACHKLGSRSSIRWQAKAYPTRVQSRKRVPHDRDVATNPGWHRVLPRGANNRFPILRPAVRGSPFDPSHSGRGPPW